MAYATLAGGCFWCMVKPFTSYPGIEDVVSGYSGGNIEIQRMNKYVQIKLVIEKQFKLLIIQILRHLKIFWMFTLNYLTRQIIRAIFDRGESYEPAIFYHDEQQKAAELKINN